MEISLPYGFRQQFRRRYDTITVRGEIFASAFPIRRATFRLNGGDPRPFYVEQTPDPETDWVHGYKKTPAELRCREQGEFVVEIPADDPALAAGHNTLALAIEDQAGEIGNVEIALDWDPTPLPLPIDLRDLRRFSHIQEVGQAVNGFFDLDRDLNVIRSRAPVAPDALLVLGSAHEGQEATYAIRFLEPAGAKWLGCSDFFAGLVDGTPPRGLQVGWCTAGMAALSPEDGARAFLAWGDHSGDEREWALATHPATPVKVEKRVRYRVRHQVAIANGVNRVRWRIWPATEAEPSAWLCQEESGRVPPGLPRNTRASFSLFQHLGQTIEWSDIEVHAYEPKADDLPGRDPAASRMPFLKRVRPGAF